MNKRKPKTEEQKRKTENEKRKTKNGKPSYRGLARDKSKAIFTSARFSCKRRAISSVEQPWR
jgi:hypothetical protein